jgi:hypothetical protein
MDMHYYRDKKVVGVFIAFSCAAAEVLKMHAEFGHKCRKLAFFLTGDKNYILRNCQQGF